MKMVYKFFTRDALPELTKPIDSNIKIVISVQDWNAVSQLQRDILKQYDLEIYNNTLQTGLDAAMYYDVYEHPDETIVVTNNIELQKTANLYFGEDSIESIKDGEFISYKI